MDTTARLWDVQTGTEVATLTVKLEYSYYFNGKIYFLND
jgi:hypothetical protein